MTDEGTEADSRANSIDAGGAGCLAGCATAIAVPAIVFGGILIANLANPNCGTPADTGGCEMGLASGTISAVPIGLGLGILAAVVTIVVVRRSRRRTRTHPTNR